MGYLCKKYLNIHEFISTKYKEKCLDSVILDVQDSTKKIMISNTVFDIPLDRVGPFPGQSKIFHWTGQGPLLDGIGYSIGQDRVLFWTG
jgi:hypothetical protein